MVRGGNVSIRERDEIVVPLDAEAFGLAPHEPLALQLAERATEGLVTDAGESGQVALLEPCGKGLPSIGGCERLGDDRQHASDPRVDGRLPARFGEPLHSLEGRGETEDHVARW